jgi:hypothetical protein
VLLLTLPFDNLNIYNEHLNLSLYHEHLNLDHKHKEELGLAHKNLTLLVLPRMDLMYAGLDGLLV